MYVKRDPEVAVKAPSIGVVTVAVEGLEAFDRSSFGFVSCGPGAASRSSVIRLTWGPCKPSTIYLS